MIVLPEIFFDSSRFSQTRGEKFELKWSFTIREDIPSFMCHSLWLLLNICRRGISKFYDGKSKSFTSLADASASSSVKEVVKPENAYSRRRRNIFVSSHMSDRSRNFYLRSNMVGISKRRPLTSSNSALVLKVAAMCNSESFSSASEDSSTSSASRTPP
ncbi:hypothetical protein EUGRSUZ_L01062 [Eucalyptus grandis]|uniref:Uncharacterized protein n=1 Tax=Eucalyptus grandis TaxID=71139 RepID=A0A058ZV82_EUCGR|nr:hypothetical protein EUGRSUZ_L01062 [Eucalyptus grandis]